MTTTRTQMACYTRDRLTVGAVTPPTARRIRNVLYHFAEHCPDDPAKISRRDVVRWMRTTTHLSAGTRRGYYTRVRGFTTWLLRHGVVRRDPFLDVPTPKVPRAVHRALEVEQSRALIAACTTPRARVLIVLGLHTGLRRAELAALEVGDVSLTARTVFVRCGKNGHQRLVPLSHEAAVVVGRYVTTEGLSSGPLLRSEVCPSNGIGPQTVSRIFADVAYRAGVKVRAGDAVGPHSLRHTAATGWYDSSGDVLAVSELLGHESLETTRRYVRGLGVERLRPTVEGQHYLDAA